MKNKTKGSLIALAVTLLVLGFFVLIFLDSNAQFNRRNDYCESKGYDGYKDRDVLGLSNKFRCVKKVSKELGYELEYSGIIDDIK